MEIITGTPNMDFEYIKSNLKKLSTEESLTNLALLIDQATDSLDDASAKQALELCNILESEATETQLIELCYFKANIWSTIRYIEHQNEDNVCNWDQVELLNEIFWLRTAIRSE